MPLSTPIRPVSSQRSGRLFNQLARIRKLGVQSFKSEPEHAYISSAELKGRKSGTADQGCITLIGAPILNIKDPFRGSPAT